MTIHHSHLHPTHFYLIKAGKKTIESRLLDSKRKTFQVGDKIVFLNRADENEQIEVEIIHLHKANSFNELFAKENLKPKFGIDSVEELLSEIKQYYSDEAQQKYGVVGIEFKVIDKDHLG